MSDVAGAPSPLAMPPAGAVSAFVGHRSFLIGAAGLAVIVLLAVAAPLVTWHDPYVQDLSSRRIPPVWYAWFWDHPAAGWDHPLGTDKLGRDYWSRLVYGSRISLFIGTAAVLMSGVIGTFLGVTLIGMSVGERMQLLDAQGVAGEVQVVVVHAQHGSVPAGRG